MSNKWAHRETGGYMIHRYTYLDCVLFEYIVPKDIKSSFRNLKDTVFYIVTPNLT